MDFDLGKIPNKKYFSIQEVSEILDIETHTIRYWEKEFANSFSIKRIGNRRTVSYTHLTLPTKRIV